MPEPTSATLSEALTRQIRMNDSIARRNLEGISHDESLVRGAPDGSHINWIVGHITGIRSLTLPALGGQPVLSAEQSASYARGLNDDSLIVPFDEVVRAFHESSERLLAVVKGKDDAFFAKVASFSPGNDPNETIGSLLLTFMIHEGYHLGQTGILRRVVGKPGAIRRP